MRFNYDEKQLRSNSHVRKVDSYTLTLSTEIRVRIYMEWRQNKDAGVLVGILEESGLGEELIGPDYYKTLITGFKSGGYPIYKNAEIALLEDYRKENPLITSGRFIRADNGRGTYIAPDFERELFSIYPEVSVEEGIRHAGLDPIDIGYQRIQKLKKEFEARHKKLYEINTSSQRKSLDKDRDEEEDADNKELINLIGHPYVTKVDGASVVMREAFYNETYLIAICQLNNTP